MIIEKQRLAKARLYFKVGKDYVLCNVCERRCLIGPSEKGYCGNRVNIDGELYNIGYGVLSAIESRPIEIKPLFHFWPNSTALTFSGWGCNFHCPWCQNFMLSFNAPLMHRQYYVSPGELVEKAIISGDEGVCASFNEPTIHLEYLIDVFREAKKHGLYNTIVSNGYMTLEALKELKKAGLDGLNFDIKGCRETYRKFIKALDPMVVFRNAKVALDLGIHVEMVFLVVTKANDYSECYEWVLEKHVEILGYDVPLHINRYYPSWKYREKPTSLQTLFKIYEQAKKHGIRYVYVGNIGDPRYETTYCPKCGKPLIIRSNYRVIYYKLSKDGRCPYCGFKINIVGKYIHNKNFHFAT